VRNTYTMQSAFGTVLWIVCGLGIVAAAFSLMSTGKTWEEYGKNRLWTDSELGNGPAAGSAAALLERDTEIRQLLEARNARRARRGEPPIDIELELNRLTAPAIDPALHAEIRDFVVARNHRRARAGKPLLDVEAEIERQITELGGL
jgi:hypothetical protein